MIERHTHPEPELCWIAICEWIQKNVKLPSGEECPEHVVKVLAVGAVIGSRFALVHPEFALALAEYGNSQDGNPWHSISAGLARDYLDWLEPQVKAMYHNYGFTHVSHQAVVRERETGTRGEGPAITDEDAKSILDGLDDMFGKGAA